MNKAGVRCSRLHPFRITFAESISMLDCLKIYADMGWALFPCSSRDKAPITIHGHKDATTEWTQIEKWHGKYPGCAWGTPTSAERGVIDVDPRNGGDKTLATLIAEHAPLPHTPRVRTGGGGFQDYLCFPPGTKSLNNIFPGIDLKAIGGYVIAPPSKISIPEHQGRAYKWEVKPWEATIADALAWLLGMTAKPKETAEDPWIVRPAEADLLSHSGSPEGERRKTLCILVGVHLARGDSEASIIGMAQAWAGRCKPPFAEWEKHVRGVVRREAEKMTTRSPSPLSKNTHPPEEGKKDGQDGGEFSSFLPAVCGSGTKRSK